jgi:hypothetical protein
MLEQILTTPWFWTFLAAIGWNLLFDVTSTLFDETFQTTSMARRVQLPYSIVWAGCHRAGQASLQGQ